MTGLESIVKAVAHLERCAFQEEFQEEEAASEGGGAGLAVSGTSNTVKKENLTVLSKPSHFRSPQPRLISSDGIPYTDRASKQVYVLNQQHLPSAGMSTEYNFPDVMKQNQSHTECHGVSELIQSRPYESVVKGSREGLQRDYPSSYQGIMMTVPPYHPNSKTLIPLLKDTHNSPLPESASYSSKKKPLISINQEEATGPIAPYLGRISMITNDLGEFFFHMEELIKLTQKGDTQDTIPTPDDLIEAVEQNDVLLGRGGETNHHSGNIQYRQLVKACQPAYMSAKRRDKPRIAAAIVAVVRSLGGRFLKKLPCDSKWSDVGNNRSREKTSQALREGAPDLRVTVTAAQEKPNKQCFSNSTSQSILQQPQRFIGDHQYLKCHNSFYNENDSSPQGVQKQHQLLSPHQLPIDKGHKEHPPQHPPGYYVIHPGGSPQIHSAEGILMFHPYHPHTPPPILVDSMSQYQEAPLKSYPFTDPYSVHSDDYGLPQTKKPRIVKTDGTSEHIHYQYPCSSDVKSDAFVWQSNVPATISADADSEEDRINGRSSSSSLSTTIMSAVPSMASTKSTIVSPKKNARGPRIKILKKRVEDKA